MIQALVSDASGLALSPGQQARVRLAARLETGTKSQRREADEMAKAIRRELGAQLDESVALELIRGGRVERPVDGPVRMSSRDGLLSLLDAGKISREQAEAGLAYRWACEAEGRIRSQLDEGGGSTGGGVLISDEAGGSVQIDTFNVRGLRRAKLGLAASGIDRAVAVQLRHRPAALQMLREVAGYSRCISAFGAGGKQKASLINDLVLALDVAANCIHAAEQSAQRKWIDTSTR